MKSHFTPGGSPSYRHVYVHVPFCGRRCTYCDFSIAVRRVVPVSEFVDGVSAEMATRRVQLLRHDVSTLYFGGGTPSKLGGDGVRRLLELFPTPPVVETLPTPRVAEGGGTAPRFSPAPTLTREVTVEVNPEDVDPEAVSAWVAAGVNRVSLGVQSFDAGVLSWMHREHTPERVRHAVATLRSAGIANLSLDLIFALPAALARDWDRDLTLALELEPEHLSLYGLTVEPRTPLGRWTARGDVAEAPEERYEQEFLTANARLGEAGFDHYEVSNYARPGRRSRHNSSYWRGVPYLGLGPAAHGFDGTHRRWNRSAYADWLRVVREGGDPIEADEELGEAESAAEGVYLGLRTDRGLAIRENELKMVTSWVDQDWARLELDRVHLTPMGWLRLDSLATALTALRSRL